MWSSNKEEYLSNTTRVFLGETFSPPPTPPSTINTLLIIGGLGLRMRLMRSFFNYQMKPVGPLLGQSGGQTRSNSFQDQTHFNTVGKTWGLFTTKHTCNKTHFQKCKVFLIENLPKLAGENYIKMILKMWFQLEMINCRHLSVSAKKNKT